MDTQETCFDCHGDDADCVFYRCNVCKVNVCWGCIANHHPVVECSCPACGILFPEGELCETNLICPECSTSINYPRCQTCPHPHLVTKVFMCSKCKKEGCGENIKICGFGSYDSVGCDKLICFDCGYGCDDECDLVRCSFEHAERCRECGCAGSVRCGLCQRYRENNKEGPICIDCINEFHPGNCRGDGGEYEFEWIEETVNRGHWRITPNEPEKEEEKERVALCEKKREDHEAKGYWYTWVESTSEQGEHWTCVPISEHKQEKEKQEAEEKEVRQPPVGKKEGIFRVGQNERDCPLENQPTKQEAEKSGGFWDLGSSTLGDELEYHTCDD